MNSINYDKCRDIVKALNNFYDGKNNIAEIEYPSEIEVYSNEYFIYMFYSCLLDYGMKSKLYHNNLANTYKVHSEIFNPSYVVKMNDDGLKNIIVNNIHPRYPNVAVKKWMNLSLELLKYNNILEYLKSIKSFMELEQFIRNIKGYGQKTGGLLLRIIYDSNICHFIDDLDSIPIDRHDIEISYLMGIIPSLKVNEKEIKMLSDAYVSVCKDLNISPSNIDKYLWDVGSSFCNSSDCINCPLNCYCIKSI